MRKFLTWFAPLALLSLTFGFAQKTPLPTIDQGAYVGSQKCAACHATYYDSWKDSPHNKMIRPAIADGPNKTILADFSKPDPNRPFELKDVKWVIGHRWKQRFIGVVNGEEVVFPAQWSIQEKKWQAYTGKAAIMSFDHWLVRDFPIDAPGIPGGLTAYGRENQLIEAHFSMLAHDVTFTSYAAGDLPNPFVSFVREKLKMPVITWTVMDQPAVDLTFKYADQMKFEGFEPDLVRTA